MTPLQGKDVIFMETATRLGDGRTHALVDCVPVSGREFAKAPIFFKKVST